MWNVIKACIAASTTSLLFLGAMPAHAAIFYISLTQSSSGNITATLNVTVGPCDERPGMVSSLVQSGGQFKVDSLLGTPPPFCSSFSGASYQLSASLGTLADGSYNVLWAAWGGTVLFAQASFKVANGTLQGSAPVPTLDLPNLIVTAVLLLTSGFVFLRRRQPLKPAPCTNSACTHKRTLKPRNAPPLAS